MVLASPDRARVLTHTAGQIFVVIRDESAERKIEIKSLAMAAVLRMEQRHANKSGASAI
jgi:hypothetical protein